MERLDERERRLLYLWYVKDASPREISRACKVSLRHCHRVRAKAIRTIVELGDPQAA
jgi:DNA-directed RNA polymerase specialized sigma subunit